MLSKIFLEAAWYTKEELEEALDLLAKYSEHTDLVETMRASNDDNSQQGSD